MGKPLILLDRDGVLNRLMVDPEYGTVDSPLHPSQVEMVAGAAEAVARLTRAGFGVAVVTNQPAWAKGKTTRHNLEGVHGAVVAAVARAGGRVLSSHLCFHRAEDGCECRKPKAGLLREAFARNPDHDREGSWMVGDGVTDVQAGVVLGLRTAFLGPRKCDACKILKERELAPSWWGPDLLAFTNHLLNGTGEGQ
jgi:D-glycero-D-manno-heptose 1,7-bisphosphate phosphatase